MPVYTVLDYGKHLDITLEGELSYRFKSHTYRSNKYKSSVTGIAINENHHFNRVLNIPSKWDLYAGIGLNYLRMEL